ncbi:MAG: tRNA pseudouridine(55) synthase TruB [Aridibacter sp.]
MNGILIIDKPEGLTSHDVVSRLRRILKTKKIGHTGTLDPFATGVLVILVGKATRLAQFLDNDEKSYEAIVRFGFETETGDKTGELRITNYELRDVSVDEIEKVLPEFTGEIEQIPPMYSAKKVKGKKLYELARKGIEIERKPVNVKISELQIAHYGLPKNEYAQTQDIGLIVTCSAGTYIRTLAEDIGRKIGVPCHLTELRRTKAGKFEIENAVTLEDLEKIVENEKLNEILVLMNDAVSHLAEKKLDSQELKLIQNGMKVSAVFEDENVQQIRLSDSMNNLIAIGDYDKANEEIQPKIVFIN